RRRDDDLLRQEDDVHGVLEGLDVEGAVAAAELHEVQRRQVAGRVVDVHVLAARVGRVDAPRHRAGVPLVDHRVVLRAGIGSPTGSPVTRAVRCQSSSFSTARMNASDTRTELLAFWYWMEKKPSP